MRVEECIVPRPAHAMNKSYRFLHFAHAPLPKPTTSLDYSDKSSARIRFVWHISGCADGYGFYESTPVGMFWPPLFKQQMDSKRLTYNATCFEEKKVFGSCLKYTRANPTVNSHVAKSVLWKGTLPRHIFALLALLCQNKLSLPHCLEVKI
jgi:hypothetical protein